MSDTEIPDEIATQTLPLDAWHRVQGGRMVEFAGYHMPVQYEGIMAEHLWVRDSAGLFDVSHMGQLVFRAEGGADVVAALESLLPADIAGLAENKQRYSLLLAENGGILDDLMITHLPRESPFAGAADEAAEPAEPAGWSPLDATPTDPDAPLFYMVVNGATKIDDIAHLLEFLPDGIAINHLEERALLALQGPKAVDALARLVPGVTDLVFMTASAFDWNGVALWISRSGYTGEDGFEISVPGESVEALADALVAEPEVRPIGLGARDSLRLEAGLPLYGHDLDPETSPVQADLGFALSKRRREAGDFMGAGPILAERAAGAASKRVGLLIAGRQPVREGATVVDESGAEIGRVTSGGFAPSVGAAIAMAYVPTELATPGTTVTLSQRGKLHTATVTAMPFIPHRHVRAGGPK
jgi:aminomethyltransferase